MAINWNSRCIMIMCTTLLKITRRQRLCDKKSSIFIFFVEPALDKRVHFKLSREVPKKWQANLNDLLSYLESNIFFKL